MGDRRRTRLALLRLRRERPHSRSAAEERNKFAAFHRDDLKPKDRAEYSKSRPCIAAKVACSCPLWVISDRRGRSRTTVYVRFAPESGQVADHLGTSTPPRIAETCS